MRRPVAALCGALTVSLVLGPVRATSLNLDQWFMQATAYDWQGTSHAMTAPDFLCGRLFQPTCRVRDLPGDRPTLHGIWELLIYDRRHRIALAHASTDQDSWALFSAPPPPVAVPDRDLSRWTTTRGLRVGSPYSRVLSLYGGPRKHASRFVSAYTASFAVYDPMFNRRETDSETITLVIVDDRVSSISIHIDCCNG